MRAIMSSLAIGLTLLLAAGCGGDDDGDDEGGTPDAAGGTLSCATYCANIDANCTGALKQYAMVGQCMATCAFFEEGEFDATTGNTLGCRDYHAKAAEAAPDIHCIHAGPTGGTANQCGEICESFCTIALAACTGANEAYDDMAACMTACGAFETEDAYDAGDTTGNTIECRMYHATVASTTPDVHCPHITAASVAPHCVAAP
jgi:hypothetical protein